MKIGFIGLGTMGFPMAHNLLKKGYELTIYNRTKDKMKGLEEKGAKAAHSNRQAHARWTQGRWRARLRSEKSSSLYEFLISSSLVPGGFNGFGRLPP